MPAIVVRNLSEETHCALKALAASHGRSAEGEVRALVDSAVRPTERVRLGSLLVAVGRSIGGADLEIVRDRTPREPLDLD